MVAVKITSNANAVIDAVIDGIDADMAKACLRAANHAGGIIAEEAISRMGGTSALARSFLPARMVSVDKKIGAGALSDLPYADIQNRGGTVYSSRPGGNLAVPLTSKAKGMWPRDWGKGQLVAITSKAKNRLLVTVSSGKKITPQYVLKESVSIHGSGYLDAATERAEPVAREILDEAIQETIDTADKANR